MLALGRVIIKHPPLLLTENSANQLIDGLSHYLQGFKIIPGGWCRDSDFTNLDFPEIRGFPGNLSELFGAIWPEIFFRQRHQGGS